MISCIVAAMILCIWGQTLVGLFLGTGLLGLGVAVQFPRYDFLREIKVAILHFFFFREIEVFKENQRVCIFP